MFIEVLYIGLAIGAIVSCWVIFYRRADIYPLIIDGISGLFVFATAGLLQSRVLYLLAWILIVLGVILPLAVIFQEIAAAKRRIPPVKEIY